MTCCWSYPLEELEVKTHKTLLHRHSFWAAVWASGVGITKPGLEAGQRVGGEIAKKADAPQLKASCVHRGESGVV